MYFQRLRDLREDKDCSQEQIAELLGIHQQTYSEYEIGKKDIPVRHLLALADFYKVSTDFILGRTNVPKVNYKK